MRKRFLLAIFLWFGSTAVFGENGLVGYWRFDKASPQVADLSGHGHTASLSGGKVVRDGQRDVLALDGQQRIVVPSAADLNLTKGFTIEARVRLDQLPDGNTVIYKDGEYSIRVDWTIEGSKLSFFVCANQNWEPRITTLVPQLGRWYHLVATWDGREEALWVNGEPFQASRHGNVPPPSQNPLVIASAAGHGPGVRGAIDYVKIYRRVLPAAEIIRTAYGVHPDAKTSGRTKPAFDFSQAADREGWSAGPGAVVRSSGSQLVVSSPAGRGLALQKDLRINVDRRDYLSLRMAVNEGSRGELVFVTTKGAGRIPFQIQADGKPHAYVLEPWTFSGWGGTLLALAIVPSEVPGATASIDYLRVTEEPSGEADLQIARIFSESTLPRVGRPERIVARLRNAAGPAASLEATLAAPEGIVLEEPATQAIAGLGYQEEKELSWKVLADRPVMGDFRVTVRGAGEAAGAQIISFTSSPRLPKADYVPRPVPAKTGKHTLWAHYCPLWKDGTHYGWKVIEPWPERKPVLGWYNEGEPAVADWHIKMMVEHGISGMVYCWYRTTKNGPVKQILGHAIHDGLLKAKYLSMIRFGIMWENGCGEGCGSADDLLQNLLPFWIDNYFSNPSYLRIDGKPVLYIWVPQNVTRDLGGSENVRKTFDRMRAICRERGLGGLHLVGCVGIQDRAALEAMAKEGWDASSAYGNQWRQPAKVQTFGDFIGAPYEGFVSQQEEIWQFKRKLGLLPDVPGVMMGWDSRPWKETPFFWSDNTPQKFRDLCLRARALLDSSPGSGPFSNSLIFCCWNEFGEGHYIEPTRGYGYSYLDVIREVFCEGSAEHADVAPEDVGLGPYDSWYQRSRAATIAEVKEPSWSGEAMAAWTGMMGVQNLQVEDGVLRFAVNNRDPAIQSPAMKVRASHYSKLVVEMRTNLPSTAQVFWTSSSMPATSEMASAHQSVPADEQFHRIVFDLEKNEHWGGCLTGIRFDPTDREGARVEIRSIRLEK